MSNGVSLPQHAQPAVTSEPDQPHHHIPPSKKAMTNGHVEGGAHHHANTLREACADLNTRVTRFLSAEPTSPVMRRTQEQTRVALSVIAKALQDYDFEALSISYNGGKDCLVLLILYLSALYTHDTQPSRRRTPDETSANHTSDHADISPSDDVDFPRAIPSIYAKPPDPFDSVTAFVDSSTRTYHLDLTHISTNPGPQPTPASKSHSSPPAHVAAPTTSNGVTNATAPESTPATSQPDAPIVSFRDAFALYLQSHPKIRAIFVGTRRTDPHGASLQHFQLTDGNWPRFVRVHPIIDWRLSEIWCFLRSEYLADPTTGQPLEYCQMYDQGYTSLGGRGDTIRNPRLRYVDDSGTVRHKPAHEMTEDEGERAGREQ